jgi:hypothetical protein
MPVDPTPLAFTIDEFCRRHNVSHSGYYKLRKEGLAPVEMMLGRKKLISTESAADWRRRMERPGPNTQPEPEPDNPPPAARPEAACLTFYLVGYNLMYADVGRFVGSLSLFWGADDSAAIAGDFTEATYAASSD